MIKLPGMKNKVNRAFNSIEDLLKLSDQRMKICSQCEHFSGVKCNQCGCFMKAKTKIPQASCPLGNW